MATIPLDELNTLLARSLAEANARSRGNPLPEERPSTTAAKPTAGNGGWPRRLPRRVVSDRSAPAPVWPSTSLAQENR